MIAHALTYLRTLRLLRNTFIGTARPPLINFCSHHAFPGNGRQFWSSSLLLLIASEVADFLITCFCFAIIVFVGKEELSNFLVTRFQIFRIQISQNIFGIYPALKANTSR